MTNTSTEIWKNLNTEDYQIILEYIGWLIIIMFILVKKAAELSNFLTNKCVKFLKYVLQKILFVLNYLNNCCSLIVDDVDEILPVVVFKGVQNQERM